MDAIKMIAMKDENNDTLYLDELADTTVRMYADTGVYMFYESINDLITKLEKDGYKRV